MKGARTRGIITNFLHFFEAHYLKHPNTRVSIACDQRFTPSLNAGQ